MKQRNKVLACIMAVLLLFCSTPIMATQAQVVEDNSGLVTLLSELGIISSVGEVTLTESVTRAQFVIMIVNMLGMNQNLPPSAQAPFLDVPAGHTAERYISLAVQAGLVSGKGDGIFEPDLPIGIPEAVKVLITILGYRVQADSSGGYPVGYLSMAQTLGLLTGVNQTNEATWSSIVRLLYNSLDANIQTITGFGNSIQFETLRGNRILAHYRGIYFVDGVVNANSLTRIDQGDQVLEGRVEIDGNIYFIQDTNAQNLLGQNVRAYYHGEQAGDLRYLLAIYLKPGQNRELTVSSSSLVDYDDISRIYTYEDNGRMFKASFSATASLVYNHMLTAENIRFMPDNGSIRFIDNNRDGSYDVVFIEDYYNIVIDYVSTLDEKVYDKLMQYPFSLESTGRRKVLIKNSDGGDVELIELVDWNVLSIFEGRSAQKEIVYIKVSTDSTDGKVTAMSAEDTVTIDEDEYELGDKYAEFMSVGGSITSTALPYLRIGDNVKVHFDCSGKIVGARKLANSDGTYAYLLKAGITGDLDKRLELKLFNCLTMKMEVLSTVSSRLMVDGVRMDNLENAYNALSNANQYAMQLTPDGMSQLVYITTRGDVVDSIDTLAYNPLFEGEDSLRIITPAEDFLYKTNTKAFSNRMFMDGNTFILTIPGTAGRPSDSIADAKESLFSKSAATVFQNSKKYNVSGYTRVPNSAVAEILITNEGGSALDNDSYISVIGGMTTALTSEGSNSYKLRLLSYNRDATAVMSNIDDIKYTLDGEERNYRIGDFVRYSVDDVGEINNIELVFTNNSFVNYVAEGVYTTRPEDENAYGPMGESIYMASQTYVSLSRVTGKNGNIIETKRVLGDETTPSEFHLGNLYTVYIVDTTDARTPVVRGTFGDVIPASIDPENSIVLIFLQWAEPRAMFVLKNSPYIE